MKINIIFKDKRWMKIPLEEIAKGALKLIADRFAAKENNFEISILASNDNEIKELNKNFRGTDSITNIISWPEQESQSRQAGHLPIKMDKFKSDSEGIILLETVAFPGIKAEKPYSSPRTFSHSLTTDFSNTFSLLTFSFNS